MNYDGRVLLVLGLLLTAISVAIVLWAALPASAHRRLPAYGWTGLAALIILEALLALRVPPITIYFTALIWTAYVVAIDAAVFRVAGRSLMHRPASFAALALISVSAWLVFEAFNLRLRNWVYVGVPSSFWVLVSGGSWAFATIYPGIFETADLLHAGRLKSVRSRPLVFSRRARAGFVALGAVALLVPLLMPRRIASYLFALVWGGFAFLIDPINYRLGLPSMLRDFEQGKPGRCYALLLSGGICGFLWEFWNYWAAARWEYVFPIFQRFKVFAMPLPGFLGFPPFAIECFTMAVLISWALLPANLRTDPVPCEADENRPDRR